MLDILDLYNNYSARHLGLAVLPIQKLVLYQPLEIEGVCFSPVDQIGGLDVFLDLIDDRAFYPMAPVDDDRLKVELSGDSLRRMISKLSGVSKKIFDEGTLVACPVKADWKLFNQFSHTEDIALLGSISEQAFSALDLLRFLYCSLWIPEALPGIPGQWKDSRGFSGGAILSPTGKGRLIGGHISSSISVTGGLGLELEVSSEHMHDYINLEQKGEVGKMCRRAFKLLCKAMYSSSDTMKYISVMALMEFLGTGPEYARFEEVKKKLLPHLARNREEYNHLDTRFKDFTSHEQEGKQVGYRHRIIHEGDLLEDIIPDEEQRKDLFKELDLYLKKILADMCRQSAMNFEELQNWRASRTQEIIRNA